MKKSFILASLLFAMASCQDQFYSPDVDTPIVKEEISEELSISDFELERKERYLEQIASIFAEIIKNKEVVSNVARGVATEYYEDENMLLSDMFSASNSALFRDDSRWQTTFSAFDTNFKTILERNSYLNSSSFRFTGASYEQLKNFIISNQVSVYWPYSENWDGTTIPTITFNTIEETDIHYGYEPVLDTRGNVISFKKVWIDDTYASKKPVWILKMNINTLANGTLESIVNKDFGKETQKKQKVGKTHGDDIMEVYIGYVMISKHLDPLFGLNNSGGAELVFTRSKADKDTASTRTIHLSKIRRKHTSTWVSFEVDYDLNWTVSEEQILIGCYERDNTKKQINISGKVAYNDTASAELNIEGISLSFFSNDSEQYEAETERETFLRQNTTPSPAGTMNGFRVYHQSYLYFTLPHKIY